MLEVRYTRIFVTVALLVFFFEAWRSPAQDYTNLLNCEVPRRTAAIYSNTRKNFRHKVSMTLFKENQRLRSKLL